MRQSLEEYIEGRLEFGGCVMWVGGIFIAITLFIVWIKEDWKRIFIVLAVVAFIAIVVWAQKQSDKADDEDSPSPKSILKNMERNYNTKRRTLGAEHEDTLDALNKLAVKHNELKNYKRAIDLESQAYHARCRVSGETHPETLLCLKNLAIMYKNNESYQKAIELYNRLLDLQCKVLGEAHEETQKTLTELNNCALKLSTPADALQICQKVYDVYRKAKKEESVDAITILSNIGVMHYRLENYRKALAIFEKTYALRSKILGVNHEDTKSTVRDLANTRKKLGI